MLISNGRCLISDLTWVTDNYHPNIEITHREGKKNNCKSLTGQDLSIYKKVCQPCSDRTDAGFSVSECFNKTQCHAINDFLVLNDITPFCCDFLSTAGQGKFFVHDLDKGIFCCVINFPLFHIDDVLLSALAVRSKRNGIGSAVVRQISSLLSQGSSLYAFSEHKENNRFYLANKFIAVDDIKATYYCKR
ncbi:hypothetical protein ABW286_12485 [Erwinia papayae]|uniref:N-acetyltransferase domain-containing protein n=1 Tax=Erwinia papayae TaxID=206499 RepID=A0ABV3N2E1_9GAMM